MHWLMSAAPQMCNFFLSFLPASPAIPGRIVVSSIARKAGHAGTPWFAAFAAKIDAVRPVRHDTCLPDRVSEKVSFPTTGSVNSFHRSAKVVTFTRHELRGRAGDARAQDGRSRCRIQGAARNGNRKRTRVRVACGGSNRPRGVGIHPSHGHPGRSIGSRFLSPLVVNRPSPPEGRAAADSGPIRRHLSSGSGLPAALTHTHHVGFVRMPAPAGRTVPTTRLHSPVVNRATSHPDQSVGMSRGWKRRTRPDSRTRLRRA